METGNYAKIIAEKWNIGRDINDVRHRNSVRLKELRRSKRSAVLSRFRQGLDTTEVKVKKTAVEEKLERLKAYKDEKKKKMEDLKKKQRPPFCSIVKARHTGGTPFRETEVPENRSKCVLLKKPVTSISTKTRSKTQKLFEFKATLQDNKPTNIATRQIEKQMPKKPPTLQDTRLRNVTTRQIAKPEVKKPVTKKNNTEKEKKLVENGNGPNKENNLTRSQRAAQANKNAIKPTAVNKSKNVEKINGPNKENKLVEKINGPNKENNLTKLQRATKTKKQVDKPPAVNKSKNLIDVTNNTRTTRQTRGRPISQQAPKKEKAEKGKANNNEPGTSSQANVAEEEPQNVDSEYEGLKKGAQFQRTRLKSEIDRLTNEADTWSRRNEENIPENVKDEILAVVGQTRLLLSQKFKDFNNLIDRCEFNQKADDMKVTLEDLEGFWDMMYREVIQLDRKYRNLQFLESNEWQEQAPVVNKAPKRIQKGTRKAKSQAPSKFKEFLKSKKQEQETVERPKTPEPISTDCLEEAADERPKTPDFSCPRGNEMEDSSFYHSANREDGETSAIPDILKTPKILPGIQRTMNSDRRKSRRSSAGLIILRQRLIMKSISSPQKNNG